MIAHTAMHWVAGSHSRLCGNDVLGWSCGQTAGQFVAHKQAAVAVLSGGRVAKGRLAASSSGRGTVFSAEEAKCSLVYSHTTTPNPTHPAQP